MGHNCSHYSFSWACWHSLDLDMMISWRDKSPYQKDLCLRGWSCCRERVLLRSPNAYSKRPTPGVFIRERRDCGSQCRCWGRPLGVGSFIPFGCVPQAHHWTPVPKAVSSTEQALEKSLWNESHIATCSGRPERVAGRPCMGSWGVSMCDEGQGLVRGWIGPLIYMLKS